MSPELVIKIAIYTVVFVTAVWLFGIRYIPHNRVGIIEKLWSRHGSLTEGKIVALEGEAGFAARLLRGGIHFGFYPWQYRLHRQPLVSVGEGKIGYVYARDGTPLPPTQTLGAVVDCNRFQDARAFIMHGGQRGRQREMLREGVYAINTALFVVITEDAAYAGPVQESERAKFASWQSELIEHDGFSPVIIGAGSTNATITSSALQQTVGTPAETPLMLSDNLGVVSVHDGPTIASGEIIAPEVGNDKVGSGHNYFQDPEAFLTLGGRRGRQLQVLTDGTFFSNRWFATVEIQPKTLIPIGYVGVVVSYYGIIGRDLTGDAFRYGEQVEPGERGV